MKTAISIPDEVFEAADQLADRLEMSRSELYSKAVAAFVAERKSGGVRERLDAVYSEVSSELDPVLEAMQSISLPDEDW